MYGKMFDDIKTGDKCVGIWGVGYIGCSTLVYYVRNGVKCIGYDVDNKKIDDLKKGRLDLPNFDYWLGFDVLPLISSKMVKLTSNWKDMINTKVAVHFICVPTEHHDKPYDKALKDVIRKLSFFKRLRMEYPPLVIIESTITADRVEKVVKPTFEKEGIILGKDVLLAVAPRRDWIVSAERTVKTLPRILGGTSQETTDIAAKIVGIVCDTVYKAPDHIHAALIKTVENTYRQVDIALANQLTLAYPHIDMKEVLRLVGTKWNMETYRPSIGIGGYCIPLAPLYLLKGAAFPANLTIVKEAVKSSRKMPHKVVNKIAKRGFKKVGILGIAYKEDLKIDILSPAKDIIKGLIKKGITVKVNDPYYTNKEIRSKTRVASFKFPTGLSEFECILVAAGHSIYKSISERKLKEILKNCKLVIDNAGVWAGLDWENIEYYEAGGSRWII